MVSPEIYILDRYFGEPIQNYFCGWCRCDCFGIAIQSRSVGRLSERVGPLDIYVSVVEDLRITIK